MKITKYIILLIILVFSIWINTSFWWILEDNGIKINASDKTTDENISTTDWGRKWDIRNKQLDEFAWEDDWLINNKNSWEKWVFNLWLNIAESIKELFFWIATIYLMIVTIKLLFAENTEEESSKFKKWVLWTTIWIIIMQWAFAFQATLFGDEFWEKKAFDFIGNIVNPLVGTMEILASVFFMWIAIASFYTLITAWWDEERVKKWRQTIIHAILWFFVIMFARIIVEWTYWKIKGWQLVEADATSLVWYILNIINWLNWFVAIIVILLIIFTWGKIMISKWDEEVIKKAKSSIIWIIIWMFILVTNWFILTIFLVPEA